MFIKFFVVMGNKIITQNLELNVWVTVEISLLTEHTFF